MDIIKHNMAELVLALNHNYREEKTTNTAYKANNNYSEIIFDNLIQMLKELAKDYPKNIKIESEK